MNREALQQLSEQHIKKTIAEHIPTNTKTYLFGSRARGTHQWNSDFDVWIDADLPVHIVAAIKSELEESIVPYKIDIITTKQCTGLFGELINKEAKLWM